MSRGDGYSGWACSDWARSDWARSDWGGRPGVTRIPSIRESLGALAASRLLVRATGVC
jgi:hypothetical protein